MKNDSSQGSASPGAGATQSPQPVETLPSVGTRVGEARLRLLKLSQVPVRCWMGRHSAPAFVPGKESQLPIWVSSTSIERRCRQVRY